MPAMTSATPKNTAKYDCDQSLAPVSRCQAHFATRPKPPTRAKAPNTRFTAMKARPKELTGGTELSKATSNGEVEGPRTSAR